MPPREKLKIVHSFFSSRHYFQNLKLLACPITKPPSVPTHHSAGFSSPDNCAYSTHQIGLLTPPPTQHPSSSAQAVAQPMRTQHPETLPTLKHFPRSRAGRGGRSRGINAGGPCQPGSLWTLAEPRRTPPWPRAARRGNSGTLSTSSPGYRAELPGQPPHNPNTMK